MTKYPETDEMKYSETDAQRHHENCWLDKFENVPRGVFFRKLTSYKSPATFQK